MTLTTLEAAARAGVHPNTIHNWIRDGYLHATRFGRSWVIDSGDLDRLKRPEKGRPKLTATTEEKKR